MLEGDPARSPLASVWELEGKIESYQGTPDIFQQWLEGSIHNFTFFRDVSPGNRTIEARLNRLMEVQANPEERWKFCMEESNRNHLLATRYSEIQKKSMSAYCTRASNSWAQMAGSFLREQYDIKGPGELLY